MFLLLSPLWTYTNDDQDHLKNKILCMFLVLQCFIMEFGLNDEADHLNNRRRQPFCDKQE